MKKRFLLLIILLVVLLPKCIFAETYTRQQLQDYIVSTALSYYYNNDYTDYEGYKAELSESRYPTMYNISPEMLSRSRVMTTQCDAFVATVYMQSLGYDFVDYRNDLNRGVTPYTYTTYWDENGVRQFAKDSDAKMRTANKYFSKIYSVSFMNRIGYYHAEGYGEYDPIVVATYQQDVYNNSGNLTKQGRETLESVDNTDAALSEMDEEILLNIRDELEPLLQPGDVLLNDGHAMLWVGNALENNNMGNGQVIQIRGGMIHSSGASFKFNEDGTIHNSSYDPYSVRYSDIDYYFNYQVNRHGDADNTIVTILRPLNKICGKSDTCKLDLPSETVSRSKFKNLKIEQYIFNEADNVPMNANTSTVGISDEISYRLELTNKSHLQFCTSGKTRKKSECTGEFKWKTADNETDYNNMTIIGEIPDNTEFVSCTENCRVENGKVIWTGVNMPSSSSNSKNYYYNVKVKINNGTITNNGMKITYDGSTLNLGQFKTKVINSVVGAYTEQFKNIIEQDTADSKTYSSPEKMITAFYSDFFAKNDKFKSSTFESRLTGDIIGNAVFVKHSHSNNNSTGTVEYYERRSQADYDSLPQVQQAISKMVVNKFYGGKKYEQLYHESNMDYYAFREIPLWSSGLNLNYGDIIVTLNENNNSFTIKNMFFYAGYDEGEDSPNVHDSPIYIYLKDNKAFKHRIDGSYYSNRYFLGEVYSADLYVVLRPSQYYSPVIKSKVTFNLGGVNWTAATCTEPFTFNSTTGECSKEVRYRKTYADLPTPTRPNYIFEGWVLQTGSANIPITSSTEVKITSNAQLSAIWKKVGDDIPGDDETTGSEGTALVPVENTFSKRTLIVTVIGLLLSVSGIGVIYKTVIES